MNSVCRCFGIFYPGHYSIPCRGDLGGRHTAARYRVEWFLKFEMITLHVAPYGYETPGPKPHFLKLQFCMSQGLGKFQFFYASLSWFLIFAPSLWWCQRAPLPLSRISRHSVFKSLANIIEKRLSFENKVKLCNKKVWKWWQKRPRRQCPQYNFKV